MDFKSLNRNTALTLPQKAALRKCFLAGEKAAKTKNVTLIGAKSIHLFLGGYFSGDEKHDLQKLFKELRHAINKEEYNITSTIGAFRMDGQARKLLRTMAEDVLKEI